MTIFLAILWFIKAFFSFQFFPTQTRGLNTIFFLSHTGACGIFKRTNNMVNAEGSSGDKAS